MSLSKFRIVFITLLLPGFIGVTGCGGGPSTEDLIMRAAQRKRPRDQDIDEEKVAQKPESQVDGAKSDDSLTDDPVDDSAVVATAPPTLDAITIKPIDERKPEQPLSEENRREMAFENLKKVGDALNQYYLKNKLLPRRHASSKSGIATLSWRVELLPYMGYEELYKQFDQTRPWNMEPNKSLLKFIPDEYVSPERFDTSTNFQVPAALGFMFDLNRRRSKGFVEDGIDNTIMLLEVSDEQAVPWTSPTDYEPADVKNMRDELGKQRKDGTFALWANGWPVLLGGGLTNEQLLNAFTSETGDGQRAGDVHREIAITSTGAGETAKLTATKSGGDSAPAGRTAPVPRATRPRERRPIEAEIAKSQIRLREIYARRIVEAKKVEEKLELAKEMLNSAGEMDQDSVGAYTLQSAAMNLAVRGGSIDTLCTAIDQRVERFDVDAYDENLSNILAFASEMSKHPDSVKGDEFLRRAIRIIIAAIEEDDYVAAAALTRHAYRFLDQDRYEDLPKDINRLRVLLGTAQREYDDAKKHLVEYREDPANGDAAATFGRFACFIKGDWDVGLPLLAMGGNKMLIRIAELDIAGAKNYDEEVVLGDQWWDISTQTRNGVYRQASRERAADWYRRAVQTMPESLDKIHVNTRLQELKDAPATSPLSLTRRLAEDLGIDLEVSLSDVTGRRSQRRRDVD